MPTTVDGDPNNYPTSITIPSDGDGPSIKAADVNVAFEALADRTANLDDRLSPIDAVAYQVADYRRVAGTDLNVNLVDPGTLSATAALVSAAIATQVGDIVEVEFSAFAGLTHDAAATGAVVLTMDLRANQNGGGATAIPGANRSLTAKPRTASADAIGGSVHSLGSFVVATAGTLVIDSAWSLTGTMTAGNTASVEAYSCVMRIWRAV